MFRDNLTEIKSRYEELTGFLSQPDAMADQQRWKAALKEQADLAELVEKIDLYFKTESELSDLREIMQGPDRELAGLAAEEEEGLRTSLDSLEEQLRLMLIPKDPNDGKDIIMEIRAGTGGEEAALFAMSLLKMYTHYAEGRRWKVEIADINETDIGGCKEATLIISGKDVYSRLKFESGVHRVQRIPETESGGRIHTSAATVAVMPEAEDIELEIDPNDVEIDTYRASGAGGQHINKTDSAVRMTHKPTGMVVTCQDERSQIKNREKAMRILKTRLYDMMQTEAEAKRAQERKGLVGSGDRSGRIRTYNFPQGRVSDHRINMTLYKLDQFMEGDMDEMIEALQLADQQSRMN